MHRLNQFAYVVAAVATCSLLAVHGTAAQDAKSTEKSQPGPSWAVQCGNAGKEFACTAYQTIAVRKSGQRLLMVSVTRPEGGKGPAMLIHLPHGLFLPAGVSLKVGEGKPKALVVQTCDAKGCYAGAALDKDQVSAMHSGKDLTVGFQNLEKKPLSIAMPLAGFAAAYAKLK